MAVKKASPFDALLGLVPPRRLPQSAGTQVVLAGERVTKLRDLTVDDEEDLAAARREVQRARNRARYQADRQNPEAMAKRKAWYEANREKVRAYKRDYDARNVERVREVRREWAKRKYRADTVTVLAQRKKYYDSHREEILAKKKAWYLENREEILAKLKAERDAAAAKKTGGQS